jgi:hypothetical protein
MLNNHLWAYNSEMRFPFDNNDVTSSIGKCPVRLSFEKEYLIKHFIKISFFLSEMRILKTHISDTSWTETQLRYTHTHMYLRDTYILDTSISDTHTYLHTKKYLREMFSAHIT